MSPEPVRPQPAYIQIANHYREQILTGALSDGDRLPSITDIAQDWHVANATAAKAISLLQVEKLIRTSVRGTFVDLTARRAASSPRDRLMRIRQTGYDTAGEHYLVNSAEHYLVNSAEIVKPPVYVADLFDLEYPATIIRREWRTISEERPVALSVSWYPAEFAEQIPDLLDRDQSKVRGLTLQIEHITGPLGYARDFYEAREADIREATALGLRIASPILAGVFLRFPANDPNRLIEYGEFCLPPGRTVGYEYRLTENQTGDNQ